jgi:hypothetical protein
MSCEACERMQVGDTVTPHDGLLAAHSPRKLRPLGRQPLLVQPYRCRLCETNWLHELDPTHPELSDWVCLYQASSILDPVSIYHQRTRTSAVAARASQAETARDTPSELLSHRFS